MMRFDILEVRQGMLELVCFEIQTSVSGNWIWSIIL